MTIFLWYDKNKVYNNYLSIEISLNFLNILSFSTCPHLSNIFIRNLMILKHNFIKNYKFLNINDLELKITQNTLKFNRKLSVYHEFLVGYYLFYISCVLYSGCTLDNLWTVRTRKLCSRKTTLKQELSGFDGFAKQIILLLTCQFT